MKLPPLALVAPSLCPRCDQPAMVLDHSEEGRCAHCGLQLHQCARCRGIAGPFVASRYHSLVVAGDSLPPDLVVSARTAEDATIMGLRHRSWPVHGVQFHPESILTGEGHRILRNFLEDR